MTIVVTQDHINNGRKQSLCECPIALALISAHDNRGVPSVGLTFATFSETPSSTLYRIELPKSARDFILDYQMNKPVHPFAFEAELKSTPRRQTGFADKLPMQ